MAGFFGGLLGSYVAPAGAYELIETLNAGSQSSVTFSSIPQTYRHLEIRYAARGGGATSGVQMRINGLSTGIYTEHELRGTGSTVSSGFYGTSQTKIDLSITNSSSTAGSFGAGIISLADYTLTAKNKTIRMVNGVNDSFTEIALRSGLVLSTSAVTSVTFLYNLGSSNFASGSRFSLYGIKG